MHHPDHPRDDNDQSGERLFGKLLGLIRLRNQERNHAVQRVDLAFAEQMLRGPVALRELQREFANAFARWGTHGADMAKMFSSATFSEYGVRAARAAAEQGIPLMLVGNPGYSIAEAYEELFCRSDIPCFDDPRPGVGPLSDVKHIEVRQLPEHLQLILSSNGQRDEQFETAWYRDAAKQSHAAERGEPTLALVDARSGGPVDIAASQMQYLRRADQGASYLDPVSYLVFCRMMIDRAMRQKMGIRAFGLLSRDDYDAELRLIMQRRLAAEFIPNTSIAVTFPAFAAPDGKGVLGFEWIGSNAINKVGFVGISPGMQSANCYPIKAFC